MIKKTLYFGNPVYLSTRNEQLVINFPDAQGLDNDSGKNTIPIEDIGIVITDHKQITITHSLIQKLLANNCAIVTCDNSHMPHGLLLTLNGNSVQTERYEQQINASIPLKKQLWQQTIKCKISNQSTLLSRLRGIRTDNMQHWASRVTSGDSENHEARAAAFYWANFFPINNFKRGRDEEPPNNLLNYGYAILRAIIARALVSSGLMPTLGIHHHNRYNAYCLADDVMEPYRPFVDKIVYDIVDSGLDYTQLSKEIKWQLLSIPQTDVLINDKRSPLMIAASQTTASLHNCFEGSSRKIAYPKFTES
ncbi:type II CRISPR-associated endonuclease Cas1 [Alkalitalea saponilacus]|uniref:CRISPR-associated endonuclease Cas1 n=1 Tax=Alkalitalea saponilacus TaxID=889453 RepID=A0A1T5HTX2_9BACT|nr:type II CRISPR-associated endonuclease Cas1 [Alkalitalea saponilacus]ASB48500.1 type II CRISPR-associated endonuclease Cas1 [Alkalitalea saponilacus]SKC24082.1 CRISP-associated protein Cas1 [Alkalitalea saponilacus]